jgi:hypothetical protein
MIDEVSSTPDQPQNPAEMVKVEDFEGNGDLTVGVGSTLHILVTALCMFDDPRVNHFLLAQKLKLSDKMTQTKIFPREGMALPNGEVYNEPEKMEEE